MKATAILITREKEYPIEVLNSVKNADFDEIIVQTECPSVYRRYELALQAKNDLIYVQDDDCTIDIEALYEKYDGRLTNAISDHHLNFYKDMGITLIGWGAFFPKKMVDFDKYLRQYPIDSLFLSQTDRIFTYLNQPHNYVITKIHHLSTADGPGRMSTTPGHWNKLEIIRMRLQKIN